MTKQGFEPKWTPLHYQRADQFQKQYLQNDKKDIASDYNDFVKWAYGKKS